jgi:hypothetical protein
MRRELEGKPFQLSEEPVNSTPPIPPAKPDSKKLSLPQGRYIAPIYCLVLLCLSIFIIIACLYYQSQEPLSYFSIPSADSSTSRIAICLVGGARGFELTGPTILKHVLSVLHSNLDCLD